MRAGDRLIEINNVNIERNTHDDVFHRVRACRDDVTLLAIDAKTFSHCKRHMIDIRSLQMEARNSGVVTPIEKSEVDVISKPKRNFVEYEVTLVRDVISKSFGFFLAVANSFMDDDVTNAGHVVHWVSQGSPAHEVGLQDGDRIIAVSYCYNNDVISMLMTSSDKWR